MRLEGRGALVTGGGRGIGAAVASALAREGARIVVASRTAAELDQVASGIRSEGGQAWAAPCDVTDPRAVEALAAESADRLGAVDILVNNAGLAHAAPLARIELDDWNELFAVNVTATFLVTRALLPAMISRGWGRVVNVASVAALAGARYIAAYAASKHAVLGFTRSVAAEAAASGVTVNAVCPGYAETPMTEASLERIAEKTGRSRAEALEAILERVPQRRLIDPEEVAAAVVWLSCEAARGVTGQAIVIDGGALLG